LEVTSIVNGKNRAISAISAPPLQDDLDYGTLEELVMRVIRVIL
jgi:hypothetical protein